MNHRLKILCFLLALAMPALACDLLPSIAADPVLPVATETLVSANPTRTSNSSIAIAGTATAAPSAPATNLSTTRQPSSGSTATLTRASVATAATVSPSPTARGANTATLTPAVVGCPAPSLPTARPSALIKSVTLAQNYDQKTDTISGAATEFRTNSVVHTVIAVQNAPKDTTVKVKWYANDVGKAAACNTLIGESELTLDAAGSGNMDFKQGPIIPVGSYRAEVYVNAVFERAVSFVIKQ